MIQTLVDYRQEHRERHIERLAPGGVDAEEHCHQSTVPLPVTITKLVGGGRGVVRVEEAQEHHGVRVGCFGSQFW